MEAFRHLGEVYKSRLNQTRSHHSALAEKEIKGVQREEQARKAAIVAEAKRAKIRQVVDDPKFVVGLAARKKREEELAFTRKLQQAGASYERMLAAEEEKTAERAAEKEREKNQPGHGAGAASTSGSDAEDHEDDGPEEVGPTWWNAKEAAVLAANARKKDQAHPAGPPVKDLLAVYRAKLRGRKGVNVEAEPPVQALDEAPADGEGGVWQAYRHSFEKRQEEAKEEEAKQSASRLWEAPALNPAAPKPSTTPDSLFKRRSAPAASLAHDGRMIYAAYLKGLQRRRAQAGI